MSSESISFPGLTDQQNIFHNQDSLVIQGITFFDDPSSCISHFEEAHWAEKSISFIQSFGTLIIHLLYKISLIFQQVEAQMEPYINIENRVLSKNRLVVGIHGLNANPSQFKKIVDEMQKRELSDTDIFIPHVLQKGQAKLDEMAMPILEEIKNWANTPGDKELVLVGVSNGGRIAKAIDAALSKEENMGNIKKLRGISIAGASNGSSIVNLVNTLGLSCLLSTNISEEMPTDSERCVRLHNDWVDGLNNPLGSMLRDYTFFAAPHDWTVPNYDSTLPEIYTQKGRYAIIPGHGHNSIVPAAAEAVAEIILT